MLQSLAALPLAASPASAADAAWSNEFAKRQRDDFLAHWRSTREYTLEVLGIMPADKLDFKPSDEQRTFAEQLEHLARANDAYYSRFEKELETPRPEPPAELTKESLRQYLTASFDYSEAVLEAVTEADFMRRDLILREPHSAQDVFLRGYMHTAHHRGQVITYLRILGIEPPLWRFPGQGDQ